MLRAALIATGLIVVPATALAQSPAKPAWYVGAGIGYSKFTERIDTDATLVIQGATSTSFRSQFSDTSAKAFAGFNVNRWLAIEGAYVNLGKYFAQRTAFAPTSSSVGLTQKVQGFTVALKPTMQLSSAFAAYGKLGVARLQTELDVNTSTGIGINEKSSRYSLFYGAGLEYDVTRNFGVRAEWEYYRHATNTNTIAYGSGKAIDYNTFFASGYYRF